MPIFTDEADGLDIEHRELGGAQIVLTQAIFRLLRTPTTII